MEKISALDTAEITIRRARLAKYVKSVMIACGVICVAAGARAAVSSSHSDPAPRAAAPAAAVVIANDSSTISSDLGTPTAHQRALAGADAVQGRQLATDALRDGAAHARAVPRSTVAAKRSGRH